MGEAKTNTNQQSEETGGVIFTEADIKFLQELHSCSDEETKRKITKIIEIAGKKGKSLEKKGNIILNSPMENNSEANESNTNSENSESLETKILNSTDMTEIINLIYYLVLEKYNKDKILELAIKKDIESKDPELNFKIIQIEEYISST